MMTRTVVLLWDSGSSVMKSSAIWDQRHCGMGSDISFLEGKVQGTLDCAQEEQEETNL